MSFTRQLALNAVAFALTLGGAVLYNKVLFTIISTSALAGYFQIRVIGAFLFYLLGLKLTHLAYLHHTRFAPPEWTLLRSLFILSLIIAFPFVAFFVFLLLFYQSFDSMPTISGVSLDLFAAGMLAFLLSELLEAHNIVKRFHNDYASVVLSRSLLFLKSPIAILFFTLFLTNDSAREIIFFDLSITALVVFSIFTRDFRARAPYSTSGVLRTISEFRSLIASSWLYNCVKLPLDVLPQLILSFYLSDQLFVIYMLARRIISFFNSAFLPMTQVLVARSTAREYSFSTYYLWFFIVVIAPSSVAALSLWYFLPSVISLIANSDYTGPLLKQLVAVFLVFHVLYFFVTPLKEWLILSHNVRFLNYGQIFAGVIGLAGVVAFIPVSPLIGAVTIQGIGMSLPLLAATLLVVAFSRPAKHKDRTAAIRTLSK